MENRYIFHLLRRNYGREFIFDKFEMNGFLPHADDSVRTWKFSLSLDDERIVRRSA
jgi:hypothetical protein